MYYIAQAFTSAPTAKLKKSAFGRRAGELVAHVENGGTVTVTFVETGFFGGVSCHEMSDEEFKQNFAVIRNKGAKR